MNEEVVRRANKEFYNRTACEYSIHQPVIFTGKTQCRVDGVLRRMSPETGAGTALDLGCGLGFVMRYIERRFDRAYGIDLSIEMARRAAAAGHRVAVADGSRLPFTDGTFDAVVCYSVLHHFYDYRGVVREASRVLKRGGYIYIDQDPNIAFATSRSAQVYRKLSAAYVSLKRFLGLFDESTSRPLKEPSEFGDEVDSLAKLAEYHHHYTPGIDPGHLVRILHGEGFGRVELYYHDDYLSLGWRFDRDVPLRLFGLLVSLVTLRLCPSYLKWLAVVARKA